MSVNHVRVLPGDVVHWSAMHPRIGQPVHSYYVAPSRALIDPMSGDGLEAALEGRETPETVLLTCRHHLRGAEDVVASFGATVKASVHGLHEFEGAGVEVEGFEWGEMVAENIRAYEAGAICPDDGVLHVDVGPGYLAFGDGVIRWDGKLAFVPDWLMDEPDQVKQQMVATCERLLELRFDGILLAHGEPSHDGGRAELEAFVAAPAQADFPQPGGV